MKSISLTLLAVFMLFAGGISAQDIKVLNADQVSKLDVSGKWSGKRKQFSWDKQSFIEVFQYEFDLKQEGDVVTGTSTIISANGEYADMKLEGVLVGNTLHFREYEVKGAIRPEGKVWCYKSGALNFKKTGDNISLIGETASYMETYNYPCSGGYTEIVKVDNSNNATVMQTIDNSTSVMNAGDRIQVNAYPNPFVDNATISYNLIADSKVNVEVYDISGKLISGLFNGAQKPGNYTLNFNAKDAGQLSGIFIVKMTVNGEIFSRSLVQMR